MVDSLPTTTQADSDSAEAIPLPHQGMDLPADMAARIEERAGDGCPCVRVHAPAPTRLIQHYILPLAWGGKAERSNTVNLCGTTYLAINDLLAQIQRSGPFAPMPTQNGIPHFARRLALAAVYRYRRLHPVAWPSGKWPSVVAHPFDSAQDQLAPPEASTESTTPILGRR